jgi:hypothetical protein
LLLDRESTERYERRLRARLRFARLRHQAVLRGNQGENGASIRMRKRRWVGDAGRA